MTLCIDKDLNKKVLGGKKLMYQPRISIQKENLKSKTKQFWLKKAYFGLITQENKKIGNFASDKFFEDVINYINNYINISI